MNSQRCYANLFYICSGFKFLTRLHKNYKCLNKRNYAIFFFLSQKAPKNIGYVVIPLHNNYWQFKSLQVFLIASEKFQTIQATIFEEFILQFQQKISFVNLYCSLNLSSLQQSKIKFEDYNSLLHNYPNHISFL